jgi:hypothetical protein
LDIIGGFKLTLDVIDINGLIKEHLNLMKHFFEKIETVEIKVGDVFWRENFLADKLSKKMMKTNWNLQL